jgi:hypothetical protein
VTPAQLERRSLIMRVGEILGSAMLFVIGLAVVGAGGNTILGLAIIGAAFASRLLLSAFSRRLAIQAAEQSYVDAGGARWWYESRTGQVAQAALSPGPMFDGPYASRADAERAPEIARERAAAWNAEDD